jgi:hypothetical protein
MNLPQYAKFVFYVFYSTTPKKRWQVQNRISDTKDFNRFAKKVDCFALLL